MSTLSELLPELLRVLSLYLRTADCSSLSLTCWRIYNAVVSVLFESIRIFDEFSPNLSHLFDKCPHIKSAARHVSLIQWDSDFVAATISMDTIYHGITSFPNITSLRLDINTVPYLCWMVRLHRLFLALRYKGITKLELKIADWIDLDSKEMPPFWQNPPIPYYCLPNLVDLRIAMAMYPGRKDYPWSWLEYVKGVMLASKETLTTLSLSMMFCGKVNVFPITQAPLLKVLEELKQLEVLEFNGFRSPSSLDYCLPLVQPDVCPKLRRIAWSPGGGHEILIDIERRPNSEVSLCAPSIPWIPWKSRSSQPPKEYACLVLEDLSSDDDPDDLDYDPPSSSSSSPSSSKSDCDLDTMSE